MTETEELLEYYKRKAKENADCYEDVVNLLKDVSKAIEKFELMNSIVKDDKRETFAMMLEQFLKYPVSKIAEIKQSKSGTQVDYTVHTVVGKSEGHVKAEVVTESLKPSITYKGKVIQSEEVFMGETNKISSKQTNSELTK